MEDDLHVVRGDGHKVNEAEEGAEVAEAGLVALDGDGGLRCGGKPHDILDGEDDDGDQLKRVVDVLMDPVRSIAKVSVRTGAVKSHM